jgi:hypothetical protein
MTIGKTIDIVIATIIVAASAVTHFGQQDAVEAYIDPNNFKGEKAPPSIVGDNVYVVWWTDKGTPNSNGEVIFRASTDGGITFGDKINLSNTTNADSTRAEIESEENNVVVTWWESNQTSNTPVMRVSNDFGETFGPILVLATNGTLGEAEAAEEEGGGE